MWHEVVIVNKKENLPNSRLCHSSNHRVKLKKCWMKDKYLDLAGELKKSMEHESDCDTNCNWCVLYSHQRTGTGTGIFGNKRRNGDLPNNSIVEIAQNTKKSPRDLRRLAVTQTPMWSHHLMLAWKPSKK